MCSSRRTIKKGDSQLCEAFVEIIDEYIEALQWCSGSQDFQMEGQARKGWEKIVIPLIKHGEK